MAMAQAQAQAQADDDQEASLRAVRYEETSSARPPIAVSVVPPRTPPSAAQQALRKARILSGVPSPTFKPRSPLWNEHRPDSGFAHTDSETGSSGAIGNEHSLLRLKKRQSRPVTNAHDDPHASGSPRTKAGGGQQPMRTMQQLDGSSDGRRSNNSAMRISMDIPSGDLFGLEGLDNMSFSNRGSIMLSGKRASSQRPNGLPRPTTGRRQASKDLQAPTNTLSTKVLSTDEEMLSMKVRSMYDRGDSTEITSIPNFTIGQEIQEEAIPGDEPESSPTAQRPPMVTPDVQDPHGEGATKPQAVNSRRASVIPREDTEMAGGLEDWENIDGRDVDRYGFIVAKRPTSIGSSSMSNPPEPQPQRSQRMSTILQLASESPRRRRTLRRTNSNAQSSRSAAAHAASKNMSTPSLRNPDSLISYDGSTRRGLTHHPFRYAANRLPGHRHRRWMDEAGDMLTLPPGLSNIAEHEEGGKMALELKRKEWDRADKWRKMARIVKKGSDGQGMAFDFDTSDPKLIARTWKGIPDRWRATAWRSFLASSARRRKDSLSDEEIVGQFWELLDQSSADDMQIDIDVPRTINSHIMFRRRYRGGQRLLFRVLHALSLYFPNTGYVQGMASLAATLLCYYEEESAFVMMVRLWQLRGLERLYQPGFGGLMEALGEFEKTWLANGEVGRKLSELGIDATAYGTRWYLTLFNYSIPFPAQLRVWDVFMLLGDGQHPVPRTPSSTGPSQSQGSSPFGGGLDVLHATSAALIDGTRDILLDSDFENAMKVLTSWIPIKDEELLMHVAKAEYKLRRKR